MNSLRHLFPAMCCLCVLAECLAAVPAYAAEPPSHLPAARTPWWDAGYRGALPDVPVKIDVRQATPPATGDGTTDDTKAIQAAIDACPTPGAVLLPEGVYYLANQLSLKSGVVLRGAGFEKTMLLADFPGDGGFRAAIRIRGHIAKERHALDGALTAGTQSVTLKQPVTSMKAGDFVRLERDNDAKAMYTKKMWDTHWARNAVGQILQIKSVKGATLTFDRPVRLDYPAKFAPRLALLRPITQAGVEDLSITRKDKSETFQIKADYAVNCWVRRCRLSWCVRAHVWISNSRWVTIAHNDMHHAHNYGGGGHGYGVVLSDAASDCLVEDNLFWSLRHSLMAKVGACGNVFAYNASYRHHLADVSIHGHWPYHNLFEGNLVQYIHVADYWGPAGPTNTFFRNRIALDRLHVKDHSDGTILYANSIIKSTIAADPSCRDTWSGFNWIAQKHLPAAFGGPGSEQTANLKGSPETAPDWKIPASLYYSAPPAWWPENHSWPAIGADVDLKQAMSQKPFHKTPAELRYEKLDKNLLEP